MTPSASASAIGDVNGTCSSPAADSSLNNDNDDIADNNDNAGNGDIAASDAPTPQSVEVDVASSTARWRPCNDSDDDNNDNDDNTDNDDNDDSVDKVTLSEIPTDSPPPANDDATSPNGTTSPVSPPSQHSQPGSNGSLQHMLQGLSLATDQSAHQPSSVPGILSPFSSRHFDPLASPLHEPTPATAVTTDTREFDLMFGSHGAVAPNSKTQHLSLAHFDSLASSNPYDDLNLASLDDVAILGTLMGYAPVAIPTGPDHDDNDEENDDDNDDNDDMDDTPFEATTATTGHVSSSAVSQPLLASKPSSSATPAASTEGTPVPPGSSTSNTPSPPTVALEPAADTTIQAPAPTLFLGADPGYFTQTYGHRRTSVSSTCSSDDEFGLKLATRTPGAAVEEDADNDNADNTLGTQARIATFVDMGFEASLVKLVLQDAGNDDGCSDDGEV
jgi:hypothetical protein